MYHLIIKYNFVFTSDLFNNRVESPSPTSYAIQSPIRILDREAQVSALVDNATMWRNISLVRSIFSEEESAMICSMPICPQRQQDRLVWLGTRNGVFFCEKCLSYG
jgi:hypothetical protein